VHDAVQIPSPDRRGDDPLDDPTRGSSLTPTSRMKLAKDDPWVWSDLHPR